MSMDILVKLWIELFVHETHFEIYLPLWIAMLMHFTGLFLNPKSSWFPTQTCISRTKFDYNAWKGAQWSALKSNLYFAAYFLRKRFVFSIVKTKHVFKWWPEFGSEPGICSCFLKFCFLLLLILKHFSSDFTNTETLGNLSGRKQCEPGSVEVIGGASI